MKKFHERRIFVLFMLTFMLTGLVVCLPTMCNTLIPLSSSDFLDFFVLFTMSEMGLTKVCTGPSVLIMD